MTGVRTLIGVVDPDGGGFVVRPATLASAKETVVQEIRRMWSAMAALDPSQRERFRLPPDGRLGALDAGRTLVTGDGAEASTADRLCLIDPHRSLVHFYVWAQQRWRHDGTYAI